MLVLIETAAGYALFRLMDKKLLDMDDPNELQKIFSDEDTLKKKIKLESFSRFKDTKQAVEEVLKIMDSSLGKGLKKFLKKSIVKKEEDASDFIKTKLIINDKQLGATIKKKLGIDVVYTPQTMELTRGIKQQIYSLIEGFSPQDAQKMAMSLSHSLNRFKIKFSPEKLDTMIIQAIALQDDMDKEINNLCMRLKEWYGWHFPELAKIVPDNLMYAKVVQKIQDRENVHTADLPELLPDEICAEIRQASEVSMGTEVTAEDLEHIDTLAKRVEELIDYRANLSNYLKLRMKAIAPNLTHMVGEVIGARLLAHSGSLLSLSKHPASTIQILGAEKALFRALKSKSPTPKYGIIYHAAIVGQAPPKLKGKISRVLAAKLSLCARVDALSEAAAAAITASGVHTPESEALVSESIDPTIGISSRNYVEKKLKQFEQQLNSSVTRGGGKPNFKRYDYSATNGTYDSSHDIQMKGKKHKYEEASAQDETTEKPKKKKIKAEP